MKKIVLISLFASTALLAQNDTEKDKFKNHKVGFNVGSVSALGDFRRSTNINGSGYAEGGYSTSFFYEYCLNNNWSFNLISGRTTNQYNEMAYLNIIDIRSYPQNQKRNGVVSVQADDYVVYHALLGVKYSIGNLIKGFVNPLVGYGIMEAPDILIVDSPDNKPERRNFIKPESSGSIIYGFAMGGEFQISKLFALNVGFFYLRSDFETDVLFQEEGVQSGKVEKQSKVYSTFTRSLGVSFNF